MARFTSQHPAASCCGGSPAAAAVPADAAGCRADAKAAVPAAQQCSLPAALAEAAQPAGSSSSAGQQQASALCSRMQAPCCHGAMGPSRHLSFRNIICQQHHLIVCFADRHVLLCACSLAAGCWAVCCWFSAGGARQCRRHARSGAAAGRQHLRVQTLGCLPGAGTPAGPPGHGEERSGRVLAEAAVAIPEATRDVACRCRVSD